MGNGERVTREMERAAARAERLERWSAYLVKLGVAWINRKEGRHG